MEYLIPFTHRHLDPVERLSEVLFGLIMALGFTGAVRLGMTEADNRALLVGVFGCNAAWAIVDGVMYVLTGLFERGRLTRIVRGVRKASTDEEALRWLYTADETLPGTPAEALGGDKAREVKRRAQAVGF